MKKKFQRLFGLSGREFLYYEESFLRAVVSISTVYKVEEYLLPN